MWHYHFPVLLPAQGKLHLGRYFYQDCIERETMNCRCLNEEPEILSIWTPIIGGVVTGMEMSWMCCASLWPGQSLSNSVAVEGTIHDSELHLNLQPY
ncbi:hypothetical protein V6N11_052268 [Hibiscus sabdariffa]|uniref:Uncharacterized protein n=1 Tax=Hibiscus sabdariffa TaxID=183260 RepID=A0ABR2U9U5_9ROSI